MSNRRRRSFLLPTFFCTPLAKLPSGSYTYLNNFGSIATLDNDGGRKKRRPTITKGEAEGSPPRTFFQKLVRGPIPAYSLVLIDFFGLGCIMPMLPFFVKILRAGDFGLVQF